MLQPVQIPGSDRMNSHGKEVERGKALVPEYTLETLSHIASSVRPSTIDTGSRRGSNLETSPHIIMVLSAKVRACGDRCLSKAYRK